MPGEAACPSIHQRKTTQQQHEEHDNQINAIGKVAEPAVITLVCHRLSILFGVINAFQFWRQFVRPLQPIEVIQDAFKDIAEKQYPDDYQEDWVKNHTVFSQKFDGL